MGRAVVTHRHVRNIDFILNVTGNEQGGKERWLSKVRFTSQVSPGGRGEGDVQSGRHRGRGPSLSRRRERPRVAEPVWDYGGKCALGVRFEAEGKAELERGGTHGFGFSTERLAEP